MRTFFVAAVCGLTAALSAGCGGRGEGVEPEKRLSRDYSHTGEGFGFALREPEGWRTDPSGLGRAQVVFYERDARGYRSNMTVAVIETDDPVARIGEKVTAAGAEAVGAKVSGAVETTTAGRPSWSADLEFAKGGYEVRGCQLVVNRGGGKALVFTCTASADRWAELGPVFKASLATLKFD